MRQPLIWIALGAAVFSAALALAAFAAGDAGEGDPHSATLVIAAEGDLDDDGIPDAEDNCPEVANADQADFDADGVGDVCDNCLRVSNPVQFDCDDDHCGNLCDCDYDQSGVCDWGDWGYFIQGFGIFPPPLTDCRSHQEPHQYQIGFGDFGFFAANFGARPGPSGTTPGSVACPIWEP